MWLKMICQPIPDALMDISYVSFVIKEVKKNPAIFCQAYHSHGKKNSIYCVIRALIMVRRMLRVKTLYLETNETNEQTQRL